MKPQRPYGVKRNLLPFLVISLIVHLVLLSVMNWTIGKAPLYPWAKPLKTVHAKKRKVAQNKKSPVYVKILDIPRPEKEEQPKKSHIIAQYSMRRKGPKGKQRISSLSGESSVLNYQPGLPITPPKPHISLVPGKAPVEVPKFAKNKGKQGGSPVHPGKEGQKRLPQFGRRPAIGRKGATSKEKLAKVVPERGPSTEIVPPMPKRRIPLFDPSLIREHSKEIAPQLGEGESSEISLDTTKSKYISYFKHIRDKLYLVWRYPLAARVNGVQGVARILFVIDKSGTLREVRLLQSSGFVVLDNEALRAIRAAAPFGPFPSDWQERELRIRARFIYRLFGRSPFG